MSRLPPANSFSFVISAFVASLVAFPANAQTPSEAQAKRSYPWARRHSGYESLASRLTAPKGFQRTAAKVGSYAHWLRHLPLLPKGSPVRSYRGRVILAADRSELAAVVDMDVGKRDRQQCADTIMRLRGEYLYFGGRAKRTKFRWAGGKRFGYEHWMRGLRPKKNGRKWTFEPKSRPSRGYRSFRRYLGFMFSWTGTLHQQGELRVKAKDARAGDFFVQGGSPGHAVVILDVVKNEKGERKALIGQGFMPAQDLHVLRGKNGSPWFDLGGAQVKTPLWHAFRWSDLRRFRY